MIDLEPMLPFDSWFCIFFLQILEFVVYQLVMLSFIPTPADQLGLSEVFYSSPIYFSIDSGVPLFVGLQVNKPYFLIIAVRYHNLLRTDHLDKNRPQPFTFHFLPKQSLSVNVGVQKNNTPFPLSTIAIALLSLLLLHQKDESVVMGSERIINI